MNIEFYGILILLIFSIILSGIISIASFVLGEKSPDKEKVSVYECGFDPVHNTHYVVIHAFYKGLQMFSITFRSFYNQLGKYIS